MAQQPLGNPLFQSRVSTSTCVLHGLPSSAMKTFRTEGTTGTGSRQRPAPDASPALS